MHKILWNWTSKLRLSWLRSCLRPSWRSSVVALMKDVTDSIERRKHLAGEESRTQSTTKDIELVSASARLLALHVNSWSPRKLLCELDRIWLLAVGAEARRCSRLGEFFGLWKAAGEELDAFPGAATETGKYDPLQAAADRVRDCEKRFRCRPEGHRCAPKELYREEMLQKELHYLDTKVSPGMDPSKAAAR